MKEIVFQQKPSEKVNFKVKMTGLAMVRPASSDKWKAPTDSAVSIDFCSHALDGLSKPDVTQTLFILL